MLIINIKLQCSEINKAACTIAKEVASERDALVCGSISHNPAYVQNKGKAYIQAEVQKQIDVFVENKIDFLMFEVS